MAFFYDCLSNKKLIFDYQTKLISIANFHNIILALTVKFYTNMVTHL